MNKRILVKDCTLDGLRNSVQMYARMGYRSTSKVVSWISDDNEVVYIQSMMRQDSQN